ncbi:hypothetical protein JCM8097_006473 [Rhodosporidiobolus ruineniae]
MLRLRDLLCRLLSSFIHLYYHDALFLLAVTAVALYFALISNFLWSAAIWFLSSLPPDWHRRETFYRWMRVFNSVCAGGFAGDALWHDVTLTREKRADFIPLNWFRACAAGHPRLVKSAAVYLLVLSCVNTFRISAAVLSRVKRSRQVDLCTAAVEHLTQVSAYNESMIELQSDSDHARRDLAEVWTSMKDSDEPLYYTWRSLRWAELVNTAGVPARAMQSYDDWIDRLLTAPCSAVLFPPFFRWSNSRSFARLTLYLPFFIPYPFLQMDIQHSLLFRSIARTFVPLIFFAPEENDTSDAIGERLQDAVKVFEVKEYALHAVRGLPGETSFVDELQLAGFQPAAAEEKLFEAILDAVLAWKQRTKAM